MGAHVIIRQIACHINENLVDGVGVDTVSYTHLFARVVCAGHLLYVSSACAPFLVLGIV